MAEREEEYELIPISPIKRLERRVKKLEAERGIDIREFFKELVAIVRMNQSLVNELAKASDTLRIEISKLPAKMDRLIENQNELISFIRASAKEEIAAPAETLKPLLEKMDKLIESNKKLVETTESVADILDEMRRKPPVRLLPPLRRRLPPPKPASG
jgi:Na+/phosphate symporter